MATAAHPATLCDHLLEGEGDAGARDAQRDGQTA
jgi:hypothetical protein